jgi:hypothetical protein
MFRILAACGLCLLAAPRMAAAEWHVTPMIGVTFSGKTTLVDLQQAAGQRHVDFGGAVTLLGAGVFGAEAIVVFTPGFFQADQSRLAADPPPPELKSSRTTAIMGNAVLTTPRRWTEYSLRPFVSGGFGLLHATQTQAIEALPPLHAGMAGFNVGGGAVGFLSKATGVRFDLRYYGSVHGTDQGPVAVGLVRLHYMAAAVGVVIRRSRQLDRFRPGR